MKISLASDHAGYDLKESIKAILGKDYDFHDFGAYDTNPVDYVDTGKKAIDFLLDKNVNYAILLCGSGQGMNIIANKHKGIRACLCQTPELAKLAREHNDANVLVLPARFIEKEIAIETIKTFLFADFSNEERHIKRIKKITDFEDK